VYPLSRSKISQLQSAINSGFEQSVMPVKIVLAIMELEAWFIGEFRHFLDIDQRLTPSKIHKRIGFNPEKENPETIGHPSASLDAIYQIAGLRYKKKDADAHKVVARLDFDHLCIDVRARVSSLGTFLDELEEFIATPEAV